MESGCDGINATEITCLSGESGEDQDHSDGGEMDLVSSFCTLTFGCLNSGKALKSGRLMHVNHKHFMNIQVLFCIISLNMSYFFQSYLFIIYFLLQVILILLQGNKPWMLRSPVGHGLIAGPASESRT